MAYIGFDLDETLGYMSGPFPYVIFLDPNYIASKSNGLLPNANLKARMDAAFDMFVYCLLTQPNYANVLRPNLLPIFQLLSYLKDVGKIKSMAIYSNNGDLGMLRLAQRMLEIGVGRDNLFCDKIHWHHPIRKMPLNANVPTNNPSFTQQLLQSGMEIFQPAGAGVKTIKTLRSIFEQNHCKTDTPITNENLFFFDDAVHPNIQKYIGNNYFQVNRYKQPANTQILRQCFIQALQSQGLDNDQEYFDYLPPYLKVNGNTFLQSIEGVIDNYELGHGAGGLYPVFIDDSQNIINFINTRIATIPIPSNFFQYNNDGDIIMTGGKKNKRKTLRRNKTYRKRKNLKSK